MLLCGLAFSVMYDLCCFLFTSSASFLHCLIVAQFKIYNHVDDPPASLECLKLKLRNAILKLVISEL